MFIAVLLYNVHMSERKYICIDLKSFYASVECVERGLDPMTTKLVVADMSRTNKTICLAITPAMKALGIHNRCRVFEIPEGVEYIAATPRMQLYIDYAAKIYKIYLRYISKDDIHVYSIDEAFMDVTDYLDMYDMTARELGQKIIDNIFSELGIRATCGIGTNLYLTKIALDISAKHSPDFIGELDEETYRRTLWHHTPLTDFWRVGRGIAGRLASMGMLTMEDIAKADENVLYKTFGVDAELLIDHAWGRESVTMKDIKNYRAKTNCLSSGQVLSHDYSFEDGKLIVKEMMDLLCLDLVDKGLVTESVTLFISYSNMSCIEPSHGTKALGTPVNADIILVPAIAELYEKIASKRGHIKRVNITCNNVAPEEYHQYNLFVDSDELAKNRKVQKAVLSIKDRYGKNAVLKGMNLSENAMTRIRNTQIGGHKSGVE